MQKKLLLSEVVPFHIDDLSRFSPSVRFKGGSGSSKAMEDQIRRQEEEARKAEAEAKAMRENDEDYRQRVQAGAGASVLAQGTADTKAKTKKSVLGAG